MKKVVSATLVGALAVGMVPAMALADDAVELQTVTTDEAFEAGTVTATDQDGNAIAELTDVKYSKLEPYSFVVNPLKPQYVVPTVFDPAEMDPVAVTYESGIATNFDVKYYKNSVAKANLIKEEDKDTVFTKTGTYVIEVKGLSGSKYAGVSMQMTFKIVNASIAGATIYEVNPENDKDFSDADFLFEGDTPLDAGEFGVALNGKELTGSQYGSIKYGLVGTAEKDFKTTKPVAAGTYVALIPGKGEYADTVAKTTFTISAYDLEKANLSIPAVVEGSSLPTVADVAGLALSDAAKGELVLAYKSGALSFGEKGSYVYTLKPAADIAEPYKSGIINSKDITIDVVEDAALTFKYGTKAFAAKSVYNVNLSDATSDSFDASKVDVWSDNAGTDKDIEFKLVITDAKGNKSEDLSLLKTPGKWTVNVVVEGSANDWDYAGVSDPVTVNVTAGKVDLGDNAYVKYNGVVTNSIVKTYNGVDALSEIETIVKGEVADTTLIKGTDYTVKVEKDVLGVWTEVDKAVDAGDYKLTFESKTYTFSGTQVVNLKVNALDVYPVIADELKQTAGFDMLYTGTALNPIAKFQMKNAAGKMVDLPSTIAVAATDYKVTIDSFVDQATKVTAAIAPKEFVKAGTYTFDIADVAGGNFVVKADAANPVLPDLNAIELTVDGRDVFVDVESGKWYAQPVYQMASKGIIGGYGNGKFGPYDNCDREDYAVMVARMLNGVARLTATPSNDNTTGGLIDVILPFEDVDAKAYYAQAVWYVWKNGIMGQGVGAEFGVNDDITREEAMTVLYRIDQEKLYNNGITMLGFADYADADEVSKWAVEAMAWGVENGLIGVDTDYLNPGDSISRAEIAAILARYMDLRKMA